ncbi:MAG: TylF/MycF/NovP-related O-methyltransferase [Rhodospirillaceae bacterium]
MSLFPALPPTATVAERYLRTVKRSLLNDLYLELEGILHYMLLCRQEGKDPDPAVIRDLSRRRPDIMAHLAAARDDGNMVLWPDAEGRVHDPRNVSEHVHTMIGRKRLDHLHACLDTILAEGIPGDLIETGVWRGGATIFMRAHLAAHDVRDRIVWVADSFDGLPRPSVKEDIGFDISKRHQPILAIDEARVRTLFKRYDLLDEHVRFLPGWFRDTLPAAPIEQLALLRLDGDLYESTMDALLALYDKVSPGGFIIVDDYGALPPCRQAVEDFRAERSINAPLEHIDWTGAVWRKEGERPRASGRTAPIVAAFTVIDKPKPAFEDCIFYHTITTPEGDIPGAWDLRDTVDAYLGHVAFDGKKVLEIGPASGFLSFHMERSGASVTSVEPSMERLWDAFPLTGFDFETWRDEFTKTITGVRNSFWYLHHEYASRVRLIETVPEAIPAAVGEFDIGLLGSILLHTRNPFSILESVAARVRDTIIVTELFDGSIGEAPVMRLIPRADVQNVDTWWAFSPAFFTQAMQSLGFPHTEVSVHHQKQGPDEALIPLFTVVGRR